MTLDAHKAIARRLLEDLWSTGEGGAAVTYAGVDILRIEDGRIAELWSFVP